MSRGRVEKSGCRPLAAERSKNTIIVTLKQWGSGEPKERLFSRDNGEEDLQEEEMPSEGK